MTEHIPSPPGYGRILPLDKQRHSGRHLPPKRDYAWCSGLNAVPVQAQEMAKAALSHPIAFVKAEGTGSFTPVVVLGLREGSNLSVLADGRWREGAYIPAFIRCHPFCVVRAQLADGTTRGVICVDESRLDTGAPALFGDDGQPTTAWQPVQALLDAADAAVPQTEAFTERLARLGLMESFEAIVMPRNGEQLRLKGLWRISEERLSTLPASELRSMIKQGDLRAAFAHLLSLEHFARLMVATATADLANT